MWPRRAPVSWLVWEEEGRSERRQDLATLAGEEVELGS